MDFLLSLKEIVQQDPSAGFFPCSELCLAINVSSEKSCAILGKKTFTIFSNLQKKNRPRPAAYWPQWCK